MSFFRNKTFWYYCLIILIITGGVFLRFWQLNTIPPGIHYDEAYNGLNALWANEHHEWKIFYPENTGREGLHINVIALFVGIFGNTNMGLRFANALWGSLTLVGFFFLLRELKFSRLSILVGTFMIATSFWHLVFSRTAYRAIMVPLIIVWMFYFFWKAVNSPRYRVYNYILAGIFLGIGFHTYIAFRIAPIIVFIVGLSFVLTRKSFLKKYWKHVIIFTITFLLSALPIFIYFSDHFKDFISRSEAVSVFNAPNASFSQAFGKSLGKHLWAFFVEGDGNPRHNFNKQPLLPSAWSVLFAIGFIISLKEIGKELWSGLKNQKKHVESDAKRQRKWFYVSVFAQSIFWVMLVPGVLSIEGIPHSLRIIGTMPGVFILSLLPIEYALGFYGDFKKNAISSKKITQGNGLLTLFFSLILMVAFGGLSQVYIYFGPWSRDVGTLGAYERKLYNFGLLIRDLSIYQHNYVITAFNTSIYQDRKQSSLKTSEYLAYPKIKQYIFYRPMDAVSDISCEDPQLVFLESDQWLRDQYKARCPDLKSRRYTYNNGKYTYWVMSNNP